jgi:tRNA 2-thiouridine synthesizing protein A
MMDGGGAAPGAPPVPDAVLDGGSRACGELLLDLKLTLDGLGAGRVLKLVSRDPGARTDLPIWCQMTRHHLVWWEDDTYYIRRRAER